MVKRGIELGFVNIYPAPNDKFFGFYPTEKEADENAGDKRIACLPAVLYKDTYHVLSPTGWVDNE